MNEEERKIAKHLLAMIEKEHNPYEIELLIRSYSRFMDSVRTRQDIDSVAES